MEDQINAVAPLPNPVMEMVTATVEIQSGPNGIIEIVGEETAQMVNGEVEAPPPIQEPPRQTPPPPQPAPPKLFNMDLERMHLELYKDRYLTPQAFLDDVGKMVHNADVRMHEDPDRLYRAQAMFTAAEVSIQDFDPQFRLECERMAVRERQRRQERKEQQRASQEAEATAANGSNGEYAPGTRRSARQNGEKVDIRSIGDPSLIERRLKRHRSNEASNDSQASGEENNGEGRSNKRSRVASVEQEQVDGLASNGVRFADDALPPPLTPQRPLPLQEDELRLLQSELQAQYSHPPAPSGLATLLNPVTPEASSTPSHQLGAITFGVAPLPMMHQSYDVPMPFAQPMELPSTPIKRTPPTVALPRAPSLEILETLSEPVASTSTLPADVPEIYVAEPEPEPMEVEREPTPLPDFHIDEFSVTRLKTSLCDHTSHLSVEQLEQLRATCLSCVWRHRSEWNRDALIQELQSVIEEFVEEIRADEDSSYMDRA